MTPNDLAESIGAMIEHIKGRIIGIGASQYDTGTLQQIETLTHNELIINAVEEIDDALVYLAHLRLRLTKIVFEHDL
jgi:hypothetical protein